MCKVQDKTSKDEDGCPLRALRPNAGNVACRQIMTSRNECQLCTYLMIMLIFESLQSIYTFGCGTPFHSSPPYSSADSCLPCKILFKCQPLCAALFESPLSRLLPSFLPPFFSLSFTSSLLSSPTSLRTVSVFELFLCSGH